MVGDPSALPYFSPFGHPTQVDASFFLFIPLVLNCSARRNIPEMAFCAACVIVLYLRTLAVNLRLRLATNARQCTQVQLASPFGQNLTLTSFMFFLAFIPRVRGLWFCPRKKTGGIKFRILLKEPCHDILSHFCEMQNCLQIDESLKITVYLGSTTPKRRNQTGTRMVEDGQD